MFNFDAYFDHSGLLVNTSVPGGDCGDTSQMQGMYRFAKAFTIKQDSEQFKREQAKFSQELDILTYVEEEKNKDDVIIKTKAHPGIYVRHPKTCYPIWASNPHTFSRDQQRSLVMAMGLLKQKKKLWQIFWQHLKRFGLYQNKQEIDGNKIFPDVASPEHWAEYIRAFFQAGIWPVAVLYPMLLVGDLCGLIGLASDFIQWKDQESADDDNLIMSVLQAHTLPTPFSWLRRKLYAWFRPRVHTTDKSISGPQSALNYKHSIETGSPPLASLYEPILKEYL